MNDKTITPVGLQFLLDCFYLPNATPGSEAASEFAKRCVANGIIVRNEDKDNFQISTYSLTPLGNAWVQCFLRVKLPTVATVFKDEHGNIIEDA